MVNIYCTRHKIMGQVCLSLYLDLYLIHLAILCGMHHYRLSFKAEETEAK